MKNTILSYQVPSITGNFEMEFPIASKILWIGLVDDDIRIRFLCDPDAEKETRYFQSVRTGGVLFDMKGYLPIFIGYVIIPLEVFSLTPIEMNVFEMIHLRRHSKGKS